MDISKYTTIRILKDSAKRMKKLKITRLEAYDEIIERMLDHFEADGKLKK